MSTCFYDVSDQLCKRPYGLNFHLLYAGVCVSLWKSNLGGTTPVTKIGLFCVQISNQHFFEKQRMHLKAEIW